MEEGSIFFLEKERKRRAHTNTRRGADRETDGVELNGRMTRGFCNDYRGYAFTQNRSCRDAPLGVGKTTDGDAEYRWRETLALF